MPKRKSAVYIDQIEIDDRNEKTQRELAIRKALRAGRLKPTPKGVLVTGSQGPFNAPRTTCEGHLWVTGPPKRNPNWQSGWCQAAKCIVCDWKVAPIDASWWIDRPSSNRVKLTVTIIDEMLVSLQKSRRQLIRYSDFAQEKHEHRQRQIQKATKK